MEYDKQNLTLEKIFMAFAQLTSSVKLKILIAKNKLFLKISNHIIICSYDFTLTLIKLFKLEIEIEFQSKIKRSIPRFRSATLLSLVKILTTLYSLIKTVYFYFYFFNFFYLSPLYNYFTTESLNRPITFTSQNN